MDTLRIQARIKYVTLILGVLLSSTLAVSFYFFLIKATDPDRPKKVVEIFGVGAALATLVYAAMTVHQMNDASAMTVSHDRIRYAADLVSQWHNPEMVTLTLIGFKIRHAVRAQQGGGVLDIIRGEPEGEKAIVCIFNYFEKVALCVEYGIVNEAFLRDFFAFTASGYYHDAFPFIKLKRAEARTDTAFEKFETMVRRWEHPSKPPHND